MIICPNCGNQLEGEPKFCHFCGSSLAAQPAAPVYEPPAPAYEAPSYEAPAPMYEQPVYQQPAPMYEQPVYQQPAPVYEQPQYEQPQYEQPQYEQPQYQQPMYEQPQYQQPAYDYTYPQDTAPAQKPAKKSKTGLIAGIAVALVVVVLAVLFLPKLLGGNSHLGKYTATSMTFMGMTASGVELTEMGDFWFELKDDNKCAMHLAGEEAEGTWKLDGEKISATIDGETMTGTLKDGKLELAVNVEGMEMAFVFEKSGAKKDDGKKDNAPAAEGTEPEEQTQSVTGDAPVGYWTLVRADSTDPSAAISEDEVKEMREKLGTELFLVLEADGTGIGSFYSETRVTWSDGMLTMKDLGINAMYTLEKGELTLVMDFDAGVKYVYVPGTGEAPELDMYVEDESDSEDLSDID